MSDWTQIPPGGLVIADLETLRVYVGARTTADDALLEARLLVAREYVYDRIKVEHRTDNDVQEAILLMASRLYKRRQSPEGVVGFGGEGGLIRIIAGDPDFNDLIERHRDYTRAGIA